VPVGPINHQILPTPAHAINPHGDIEISISRHIMVEHGKELACGSRYE
jgi:hypothetical protein